MNGQQEYQAMISAGEIGEPVPPTMYFPVSLMKLTVMSICTFGLYQLYWFYRNWRLIKEREEIGIAPVFRAYFASLFCYALFMRIQDDAEAQELPITLAAGFLAAGWIVLTLLVALPDPYWLITFLSVIFLLPVQSAVNDINREMNPKHDPNSHFSWWNMAIAAIGGILLVFVITGTLFPDGIAEAFSPLD
jgi:hypothetical protein